MKKDTKTFAHKFACACILKFPFVNILGMGMVGWRVQYMFNQINCPTVLQSDHIICTDDNNRGPLSMSYSS